MATPIRQFENIFVKLEAFNPGGSHKFRAAKYIVDDAFQEGSNGFNKPVKIIEKTGGNFGIGLACAAMSRGLEVHLVVGKAFLSSKRFICQQYGATLVGQNLIERGFQPAEVIEMLLLESPGEYFFTDQFQNPANLKAHQQETGPELVEQLMNLGLRGEDKLILVKSAGTGASFTGVASVLKDYFPNLVCHLVFPNGCDLHKDTYVDHRLDGIAVGRRPPFLELSLVDHVHYVSDRDAASGQAAMAKDVWFYPGRSSGAVYFVSKKIAEQDTNGQLVVTFAYDSGEAYVSHDG
jgi:cysteine synthase